MAYYFAILKNERDHDHIHWIEVCEKMQVNYKVIDLVGRDWMKEILAEDYDCFLTRPPGLTDHFKRLYDERLYVINHVLGKKIYPTYEEIFIYENKRVLSYWLQANNIPHPKTWVFYRKEEAIRFSKNCSFPVVAKTSIGAGGTGVDIIKNKQELTRYIDRAFSSKGIVRSWGPNLRKGNVGKRILKRLRDLPASYEHFREKRHSAKVSQANWFVIFQEYIDCDFEWRCVCINDSYFGHKKLRTRGEIISGTTNVSWDPPSEELLNFIKYVCDKRNFLCQAVDIFVNKNDEYLVNEMQCFFGSKNPHQMLVKGKPGRYVLDGQKWIFEEGHYNTHNSYELRLRHAIRLLDKRTANNKA